MPDNYTVVETVPTAEAFCRLREISGLSPRPLEAAQKALPGSCYGMHIVFQGKPVGMGRIVGDGALNFDIVDVAVDPLHQGKGLGRKLLVALIAEARRLNKHVMVAGIESQNHASLHLHETLGFITTGQMPQVGTKFGRWLDLTFMQLQLDERSDPDAIP